MAEYAGYVASTPVNYGEITKDLVNNYITIDQAKREEDRKTKAEMDKNLSSNLERLKDFNLSASPSFNNKLGPLSDGYKTAIMSNYKTGGVRAANLATANALTSINNIKKAQEVIDANYGEIKKAVGEGKVSKIGTKYAQLYQNAIDFSNAEFVVMPDATTTYVKYDKDGKILEQNSFFDPATLASTQPFIDPNVDYEKNLNDWMKSVGSYKDEQGQVTIVSPKNNPAFPKAKETKINELVSTDRNTARFLTELGGYDSYTSQAEKEELLRDNKFTEDKLIEIQMINGIPQPILSKSQRDAARQLAEEQIDQRVGFAKTLDEDKSGNAFGAMATFYERENYKAMKRDAREMKPIITRVKNADKIFRSKNIADWGPLKEAARFRGIKDPTILHRLDGSKVLSGIPKGKRNPVEIVTFNSPEEIYAYTSNNKDVSEATGEYAQGKEFMSMYGTGGQESRGPSPAAQPKPAAKPAAKETINIDIQGTINAAKAQGKTVTPAQVKAKAMKDNPGKKIIWN